MTNVIIEAGELTASAEDRIVSGLLLPYGEQGRTNLGRFTVEQGDFQVPADPEVVTANTDHARQQPVGRAVTLTDSPRGLFAAFKIGRTPEGDQLLAEHAQGKRRSLSVEVTDVVIRAGRAVAGRVYGAAFVERGAFPSATLLAADVGEDPNQAETAATTEEEEETMTETATAEAPAAATETTAPAEATTTTGTLAAAQAPHAQLPAGMRPSGAAPTTAGSGLVINEPADLFAALARLHQTQDRDLMAALSDVKISGANTVGSATHQPVWIGKLWQGLQYIRRATPVATQKELTALQVKGWKWTTKPRVERWAGNKANVPSNAPAATNADATAQRFAGAHDIAREFHDFPNPEFWEAYFEAMRESYAWESDVYALETWLAGATAVERGSVPTDVSPALVKLVDGALAVNKKAAPTFAFLAEDVWREYVLTPKDHVLEMLSSSLSNLTEGQIANFVVQPTPYDQDGAAVMDEGQVLVGTRAAITFRELGGSPIRVEGLDMVKGGIDPGLFGYALAQVDEPLGLALVTDPVTP
ncbi:hypothetical protein CBR64_00110 [Cellulosimicrobium cellulans]|uniref:Uncharacterized protein n=1 Tax=Cellulosimicrobium cellulans TaxID=1710 RepID=A0A1Y0HS67_CELCE|nr:hypothetical protein [Cellulosimicrobium cellulans]ARU50155.1 hypothetical protein CBR64_00110 [Cellulosimicrobium cellulans]